MDHVLIQCHNTNNDHIILTYDRFDQEYEDDIFYLDSPIYKYIGELILSSTYIKSSLHINRDDLSYSDIINCKDENIRKKWLESK